MHYGGGDHNTHTLHNIIYSRNVECALNFLRRPDNRNTYAYIYYIIRVAHHRRLRDKYIIFLMNDYNITMECDTDSARPIISLMYI